MRYVKRGWTLVIFDEDLGFKSNESGIYHADTRLIRRMGMDYGFKTSVIRIRENGRVLYVEDAGNVLGVIEESFSVKEGSVEFRVKFSPFEEIDFRPFPIVELDLTDMMEIRGFSRVKNRSFNWKCGKYVHDSDSVSVVVNVSHCIEGNLLKRNEIWEGSITADFEIDFKRKPHSLIFSKTSDDSGPLDVGTKFGSVPVAGIPWYSTLFGRDLLVYSLQVVDVKPDIVRRIISLVSKLQAEGFDEERDSQPGKVFHEMRFGISSVEGENPFDIYYGTVDATLLFPIVVWRYYERTRDDVKDLLESVDTALRWALNYGDIDGDGFVEYTTDGVLRNKGWKDSDDAIVHPNGEVVVGPIALVEVQGYLYDALVSTYKLHEAILNEKRTDLMDIAENLKEKFAERFKTSDYFALALDGEKRKVMTPTSNPANALFTGIYSKEDADLIVERIFKDDLLTPYGIRTLSSNVGAFNPVSYHRGSIWPHDNSLIILGLERYGYVEEAKDLTKRLMKAKEKFGHLPELYVYVEDFGLLPYPGACKDQLWAIGTEILLEKKLNEWGVIL